MTLILPPSADRPALEVVGTDYPTPGDLIAAEAEPWHPFPYLVRLNDEITTTLTTPNSFLAVELPIRHGKSRLGTVGGIAWWLLNFPGIPFILGCHTDNLASRFGRQIRAIVRRRAPEYGLRISPESHSAKEFQFVGYPLGGFKAVGVGTSPTGTGAGAIGVDDPVKNMKQLRTIEQRDELWEWFTAELRGRLAPGGSMFIIMSRWHEDDIIGRIFSPEYGTGDPWRRLTIPALALEGDPMGRAPGQALCPELGYNEQTLQQLADTMGPRWFAAQFQAAPQAPAAKMFKPEDWTYCTTVPAGSTMVRWWDNAATKGGTGAFTAGVLIARTPAGRYIVVDVWRGRVSSAERKAKQRELAIADNARWSPIAAGGKVTSGAEQEPGSGGKDQAETFRTEVMDGLPAVSETTSSTSKEVRAELWSGQQGGGRVAILQVQKPDPNTGRPVMVAPEWAQKYMGEHSDFPTGATKDMVDASAHAANYLALRAPKGTTSNTLGTKRKRTLGNPNV